MADSAQEGTVAMYLRVARTANEALGKIAGHLGMKQSAVTNVILRFVLWPDWFVDWQRHVETLRSVVAREKPDLACMADFNHEEWQEHYATFKRLEELGLIEQFDHTPSLSESGRIICTFHVTDAGRVIAQLFEESGMTKAVRDDELTKPQDGEPMAS
jgi:hypothetical protein